MLFAAMCKMSMAAPSMIQNAAHSTTYSDTTILQIDGVGAFDHVKRAAMLRKLHSLPNGRRALPFVRLSCGSPTEYIWTDDAGCQHAVELEEEAPREAAMQPRHSHKIIWSRTKPIGLESGMVQGKNKPVLVSCI